MIKIKNKFVIFIKVGFLVLALFILASYINSSNYFSKFNYNLHKDYLYAFPANSMVQVELKRSGFDWPTTGTPWDTAFLKINVNSNWLSLLSKPFIKVSYHGEIAKQYFEKTASGIRYINISGLINRITLGMPSDKVRLEGHNISWKQGLTELYRFQNVDINKEKILIIAPHPDDAEIAAFGLYDNRDAYIVTITAGESGKPRFKQFFPGKREHALFQGTIRTWDSITAPFWGGIMPERCINLGYFDDTLKEMFENPSQKVASVAETTDLTVFRKYNISPLITENIPTPTWNNLVEDLSRLIKLIKPTMIVTPSPLTDSHPDHQFATIALLEAIEKNSLKTGSLYLYTVHDEFTSRWPFGSAKSIVSLPPYFLDKLWFDKVYSYSLSNEDFIRKLFVMDDMHGFRPVYFLSVNKYSEPIPVIIQSAYLQWKTLSQTRKYLRNNELFFVVPIGKSKFILEEILNQLHLKEKLRTGQK